METGNRDIQGNQSVSRNSSVGGDLRVGGRMDVHHNLRVDGWLEARHVVGPMKGLYRTEEDLLRRWPRPEAGWWALVGESLPAEVWREEKGRWRGTGELSAGVEVDLSYYDGRILDLDRRLIKGIHFTAGPDDGLLRAERTEADFLTPLPGATLASAGLMRATDVARLAALQAAVESLTGTMGPSGSQDALTVAISPLPESLAPGEEAEVSVSVWRGGRDVTARVREWRLVLSSGAEPEVAGAGRWHLEYRHLSENSLTTVTVEATLDDGTTGRSMTYLRRAMATVTDRGAWKREIAASDDPYLSGDRVRKATGRHEIHDTHRHGCRWRCLRSETEEEPGYGCADWEYVEGARDFRIDFAEPQRIFPQRFATTLTVRGFVGEEDVTHLLDDGDVVWSRETTDVTGARRTVLDRRWNAAHGSDGLQLRLTHEDRDPGGYPKLADCTFTATVTLRDPTGTEAPQKAAYRLKTTNR